MASAQRMRCARVKQPKQMEEPVQLKLGRLLWGGPLTLIVSVTAVQLIRTLAVAILNPDEKFMPLTKGAPTFDTVLFGGCAIVTFFSMCRYSLEPVREYRSLAWKVLLVSFGPDIALAILHGFGGGWPEALALMTMHIAVWAICVTIPPALVMPNRRLTKSR